MCIIKKENVITLLFDTYAKVLKIIDPLYRIEENIFFVFKTHQFVYCICLIDRWICVTQTRDRSLSSSFMYA